MRCPKFEKAFDFDLSSILIVDKYDEQTIKKQIIEEMMFITDQHIIGYGYQYINTKTWLNRQKNN